MAEWSLKALATEATLKGRLKNGYCKERRIEEQRRH